MNNDLSLENERYIQTIARNLFFSNRREALDQAVTLLKKQQDILHHIDVGTRQIKEGNSIKIDNEVELEQFFAEIKTKGKERLYVKKKKWLE
ncbi:MAG: hypothetical protein C4527_03830 [Candidatus Omnitrophota bacterium]|jgi:LPS sulfotransferase NodH|nr:MAG: hypothetical protein C4527_03830 [Candidatus Omnitrophota bacterium]